MTNLLQAIFNGILTGGVYAVVSVGLSLVFGIVDVVNFAQPEFLMMGMFVAYFMVLMSGLAGSESEANWRRRWPEGLRSIALNATSSIEDELLEYLHQEIRTDEVVNQLHQRVKFEV